jgi:hypothetical protein
VGVVTTIETPTEPDDEPIRAARRIVGANPGGPGGGPLLGRPGGGPMSGTGPFVPGAATPRAGQDVNR